MQYVGIKTQPVEYSFLLQQRGQHDIGVAGRVDHVDLEWVGRHQPPGRDQAENGSRPGAQNITTVEPGIARLTFTGTDHGNIRAAILEPSAIEIVAPLISFLLRQLERYGGSARAGSSLS